MHELKRFGEALASHDHALTLWPDYANALSNRSITLRELKRFEEALDSYDRALIVRPDFTKVLSNRCWTSSKRRWRATTTRNPQSIAHHEDSRASAAAGAQ